MPPLKNTTASTNNQYNQLISMNINNHTGKCLKTHLLSNLHHQILEAFSENYKTNMIKNKLKIKIKNNLKFL